ncbi:EAL domain-containing protein [Anaerotignum propionicum]|jgi:diguanylate cyclase (GGDEF)-like protein|uniref:bifunctional diguanylate cyclase/phosphodiesterase n=1 Tax=Anaerotignum propionicum TaxID=28446 RepID=UPI002896DB39|nr:EAL domain-containing protein [Anaerotignum propionicum]
MNKKRIVILSYINAAIIVLIGAVELYILLENATLSRQNNILKWNSLSYRSHVAALILALTAIIIFFFQLGVNRMLKKNAYTDITGIMNKHACLEQMSILDCRDSTLHIGLAMFDLNNLKKVNDFYGHEKGDRLIQQFVILLRQSAEKKFFLGRFGGDEFIVIIQNCNVKLMEAFLERIRSATEALNKLADIQISYAQGYAISTRENYYLMDELLQEADKRMYENKRMIKSGNLLEIEQISKMLDLERVGLGERDSLTGMLTFDAFLATVEKVLRLYKEKTHLALVCTGMNHFRYINDLYGHKEGDNILKQFAYALGKEPFCLCSCRLYSDNFAFLADLSEYSEEEAEKVIQNWNTEFSQQLNSAYSGSRFVLKSGIYFIRNTNMSVEEMLTNADCARKSSFPPYHNIVVFSHEINQSIKKRWEIIHSFQSALENQEFHVYIQPKVLHADKKICSAEALIRWKNADGTFLSPDAFIPILEETGDIVEMDHYVYDKVFAYLHERKLAGKSYLPISVNVSRLHLYDLDLFWRKLHGLEEAYPIPPSLITFELTESAYIQEIDAAEKFVVGLHEKGYRVSLDDFGSGYSSLKALSPMIFDEIKFDRAFLKTDITKKEATLLLQLIKLVKSLNTAVVCEGVETAENVALLDQSQCDIFQGYFYHKPFPIEELESVYLSQQAAPSL